MSASQRPAPGAPRDFAFPETIAYRLSNGLRVLCAPMHRLPAATLLYVADAGAERESVTAAGVASLTAQGLAEGTTRTAASELVAAFELLGGELGSEATWTNADCGVTVLREQVPAALKLLAEAVRESSFPAEGVARLREERLNELLQQQAEPRGLADDAFAAQCLGTAFRGGLPSGGTEATVRGCDEALVRAFHAAHYRPDNGLLVVAGDVNPDEVARQASLAFAEWRMPAGSAREAPAVPDRPARGVTVVDRGDAPQTELRIGHAGVGRLHPDFHALSIANAIVGGLFNSRINMNLREAHGYTYGAFSSFDWRRDHSLWEVSTAVKSDVTAAAAREVLHEIARIRDEPVRDDELSLARDYLVGVFPLRFETTAAIAGAIAARETYGLPVDYYETYRARMAAVTVADVQRVAQAHWRPEDLQVVAVGDAATIRAPLTDLVHAH